MRQRFIERTTIYRFDPPKDEQKPKVHRIGESESIILQFPKRRATPPTPQSDDWQLQRWIDMNG